MEDKSLFEKEQEELGELIDAYEQIVEMRPYSPNRATRRQDAKRNRALQKRNPRG